jgi:hypothetical protein
LAFGDNLGGIVAGLTIPEGFRATTTKSKNNIFHACPPGRLPHCRAHIVGRRTVVVQPSIYRSKGKLARRVSEPSDDREGMARIGFESAARY